jgi:hypothetical protein
MTSTILVPAGDALYGELDLHFTEPEMSYPTPADPPASPDAHVEAADAFDEQILAGLVSP